MQRGSEVPVKKLSEAVRRPHRRRRWGSGGGARMNQLAFELSLQRQVGMSQGGPKRPTPGGQNRKSNGLEMQEEAQRSH